MIMTKNRLILNKAKSSDCNFKKSKIYKNFIDTKVKL